MADPATHGPTQVVAPSDPLCVTPSGPPGRCPPSVFRMEGRGDWAAGTAGPPEALDGGGALKRTFDEVNAGALDDEHMGTSWALQGMGPGYRCLDQSHGHDCLGCTPSPPVAQENLYELTGGGCTSKEGEKVRVRARNSAAIDCRPDIASWHADSSGRSALRNPWWPEPAA